jgi:hypothetical protein
VPVTLSVNNSADECDPHFPPPALARGQNAADAECTKSAWTAAVLNDCPKGIRGLFPTGSRVTPRQGFRLE